MSKGVTFLISLALLLGFILRLLGIKYGLADLSHPDEARVILDTLSMGHRMSLLPERPDYALLYRYFLLFLYGVYYLTGRLLHFFSGPYDFALKFFINPTNIYLISRFISVIFGTAIAIPAYIIGKKALRSQEIAVAAFIFVLFEFQLLQHSQWAIYPIILSFFTLPAFYFMFKLLGEPSLRNFILSGLSCGLAISVQNQGVFLVPSLITTYILTFKLYRQELEPKRFLRLAGISLLCFAFFSLLGNCYWFFIFKKSWTKTMELWGVTRVGFSSAAPYSYNIFSMVFWFAKELMIQDLFLGLIMVLGLLYSMLRRKPYDIVYVIFILTYLYFTSKWGFRILHDMLALLPIMCVFGARFLAEAMHRFSRRRQVYLASFLIVLPVICQSLSADIKKWQKDTRIIAKEWIENNIPAGTKIGVDWSVFSVPLESDTPFLLRNPIAKKYYEVNLKPLIGARYQEYLNSKKTYKIVELMCWSDSPLWPKDDMPQNVIQEASKQVVYRDLYSRFIFKDFNKIINDEKLDYIIITSYAWGHFLFDSDPYKKNLFNPFIKDRPVLNYRQPAYYIDDKRHGYIFYLIRQGRDFYTTLLYNKHKHIQFIKEFSPIINLGPTIRIYKIARNAN